MMQRLALAAVILLLGAPSSGRAQAPTDDEIRGYLSGEEDRAERWLALFGGAPAPDQAPIRTPLDPGYHRLGVPGWSPPVPYVALIPQSAAPPEGRPLLVAHGPVAQFPSDELPLRAMYAPFLDAGFTLLVPVPAGREGLGIRADPMRSAWNPLGSVLPAVIGDLATQTPVDRERVFILGPWGEISGAFQEPRWLPVDATPFAGTYMLVPGPSEPKGPTDPDRWAGRAALIQHGTLHTTGVDLLAGWLRTKPEPLVVRTRSDSGLNWRGTLIVSRAVIEELTHGLRRPEPPPRLRFRAGATHPVEHEWLRLPTADGWLVEATWDGNSVTVTTPETPNLPPFPFALSLPKALERVTVSINGKPVLGGAITPTPADRWRALRQKFRTGRNVLTVVTYQP